MAFAPGVFDANVFDEGGGAPMAAPQNIYPSLEFSLARIAGLTFPVSAEWALAKIAGMPGPVAAEFSAAQLAGVPLGQCVERSLAMRAGLQQKTVCAELSANVWAG
jgi:hypothetical protein